jgi:hypothetical protein
MTRNTNIMNRHLAKEFRQLRLPWCVAAISAVLAGSLMPLKTWLDESPGTPSAQHVGVDPFLIDVALFGFFGGIALLAAMSFGTEFQQRTLPLWLSQPLSRARMWREKMLALAAAVASVLLLLCLSQAIGNLITIQWSSRYGEALPPLKDILLTSACILATVCSSGFWTFIARSTIGGMVFNIAGQFLVALVTMFILEKAFGSEAEIPERFVVGLIPVVGLLYSALFLWLGRRQFAQMELRDVSFGENVMRAETSISKAGWLDWLRCRPTGSLLNLKRKELRLLKPVFTIAAVFTFCWFVTLGLMLLQPARQSLFEGILNVLTGVAVVLLSLLAGSVSLGDEKSLGPTAWHLTLPVSARRQWLVKLGMSFAVGATLALLLPLVLSWIAAAKVNVGLYALLNGEDSGSQLIVILAMSGLIFLLSFWAATLSTNTVRAAMTAIFGLVTLGLCVAAGTWGASRIGGLQTVLLTKLVVWLQLPLDYFFGLLSETAGWWLLALTGGVFLSVVLAQSLAQFRCAQSQKFILLKYSIFLAVLTIALTFWNVDLAESRSHQFDSALLEDLTASLCAVPAHESEFMAGTSRVVTLSELEKTGKLSGPTKTWLRNSSITVSREPPPKDARRRTRQYWADIQFPNGRVYLLAYAGPLQFQE